MWTRMNFFGRVRELQIHRLLHIEKILTKKIFVSPNKTVDDLKPAFRLFFVSSVDGEINFSRNEGPLLAVSCPQYVNEGNRMETVYTQNLHNIMPFKCLNSSFPYFENISNKEIIQNPPSAVILSFHPSFDIREHVRVLQSLFKESCLILAFGAGITEENAGYVYCPETGNKEEFGARGLAIWGSGFSPEDMAQIAKRINGKYILPTIMSAPILQQLFVPSKFNSPKTNPQRAWKNLPLFNIGDVLFPGSKKVIDIFEPRYKIMLKEHLELGTPFGVRLGASAVGTICRVEKVEHLNKETGEARVTVIGESRFLVDGKEALKLENFGLFAADAVRYDDEETPTDLGVPTPDRERTRDPVDGEATQAGASPPSSSLVEESRRIFRVSEWASRAGISPEEVDAAAAAGVSALSFLAASASGVATKSRQNWLEMTNPEDRLSEVLLAYHAFFMMTNVAADAEPATGDVPL